MTEHGSHSLVRVRTRSAVIGTAFEALFASLMPIVMLFVLLPPGLRAPVGAPLAVAIVVPVALRAWRLDLVIDRGGVLVKSYWRTTRIPWSQLDAIELTSVSVMLGRGSAPAVGFRQRGAVFAADTTVGIDPEERRELGELLRGLAAEHAVPCRLRVIDREWVAEGAEP